ncbi:MAG: ribonuclease Z [Waddliaceae bacterium]|jgi:ribonuclease Z|nr:ribonuclease Z [Waddliaceae bacterium]MBT3578514.1 ribonuclease Z [Waddliaceae bacterium]MBT4444898.1 ribonuclease Z [Waddliaceae bacterium]MBT6928734.1 ribonuclease Z [Waddliaceae bacterium]MBT7264752.1 ribonuclease Z [Waddliaceae bacterium]
MSVRDITILGCSSQQPTRHRNHGAYLVRWNNEGLLFDPGEGCQRQFIHANVAPTCVKRIFISHFHGDHCLGLGSMLMRLNLDKVTHTIHCYYPASGQKFFRRLRYSTIYHETITVVEHPVSEEGIVEDDGNFKIEAAFLEHGGIDNIGWRITEPDTRKFDKAKLDEYGIVGPMIKELTKKGTITADNKTVTLDDVSTIRHGDALSVVIDTRYCQKAIDIARGAKTLICESTYLEEHKKLANKHYHLTAKEAATIAKEADVKNLILTHFSARYNNAKDFIEEASAVFPNVDVAEDFKVFQFTK